MGVQNISLSRSFYQLAVSMVKSHSTPLSALFFKEEIKLASSISLEMREQPTPNSDLDYPKEITEIIGI